MSNNFRDRALKIIKSQASDGTKRVLLAQIGLYPNQVILSKAEREAPCTTDTLSLLSLLSPEQHEELSSAKKEYSYENRLEAIADLENVRKQFVSYFSKIKILGLDINDYAIGQGTKDWHVFCYGIERTFNELGCILGSTSLKFGIYYSPTKKEYIFSRKFGTTPINAFTNIKLAIVGLINAGKKGDLEAIANNPLSSMFKGKILSIYYPEKYLNIFSDSHLDFFLTKLNLDSDKLLQMKPVYKRDALVEFKNSDPDMKSWTMDKFADFLYTTYPKLSASKGDDEDDEPDLQDQHTPDNHKDCIIDTTPILTDTQTSEKSKLTIVEHKNADTLLDGILKNVITLLEPDYIRLYSEKPNSGVPSQMVDLKGIHKETGEMHFFEVRPFDAIRSIRDSLGAIIEYSNYSTPTPRASQLFIIGICEPSDKDVEYLNMLRSRFSIPVWYRWLFVENNQLSKPI